MHIDFECQQCGKLLRVGDENAGARAQCSSCGAINIVPSPKPPEIPSFGAGNLGGGSGFNDATTNPYAAPQTGYTPRPTGFSAGQSATIVPTAVEAGDVLSYAWKVFQANLGVMLSVSLIVLGVAFAFGAIQGAIEEAANNAPELNLLSIGISVLGNIVQMFLGIGQCQIALKLLRGQTANVSEVFGGGPLFLPVLGGSILFGIASFVGIIACIIPFILLMLLFWPFYYLIVDQKSEVMASYGVAYSIGKTNPGTTFILWLASFGIMLLGFLAFCVGVIFAAPYVSLIWGAAYLMMSGQLTPNPQQTTQGYSDYAT
jgi:hypothetical protein